jgi:hypothetical protein
MTAQFCGLLPLSTWSKEQDMTIVTYDKFREDTARMFEGAVESAYKDLLEKAVAEAVAAERKEWPNLDPVITWLENGCDPKEAAKELRIYAAAIRARTP